MKAIIYGINGQDGQYMKELLQENNCEVIGISRGDTDTSISHYESVLKLQKSVRPDFIFHFAANSTTSHDVIFENYQTIVTGSLNILEAIKRTSSNTKVFISGSGLQFKNEGTPINEACIFEAKDAYSLCRINSAYAARYYRSLGIKAYIGYFFNHDSPFRSERHMSKKIVEAAKRIRSGSHEKIEIGNIKTIKEYSFAGDIVKAVWKLIKQEGIYEAVIGSGKGYSIEEWLKECFKIIGRDWREYVTEKKGFIADYSQLISDPALIMSLGWKPEINFKQLAQLMMQ